IKETRADSAGKFSISVSTKPFGPLGDPGIPWLEGSEIWEETPIAASLAGFGPAWVEYRDIEQGKPLTLRLVDDVPIQGQVVDLEGNPVPGVVAKVTEIEASTKEDLTEYLAEAEAGGWIRMGNSQFTPRRVDLPLIGLPETVKTDKQGRFELRGLGKER